MVRGLRKCGFFNLGNININKDRNGNVSVRFDQQKTDNEVVNPANTNYLLPILNKYKFKLP